MAVERGVISVAELDRRLKGALEGASGRDWVQGEIGGLRRAASGHVYFTLRDEREEAVIDAVMYRYPAQRARRYLENGTRVQVFGKATLWAPRGRMQLIVDALRPVGRGALLEALEKLKLKLQAEGLFAPERKKALPTAPRCVGVVTSAKGAAWHDIRKVALRRAAVELVLSPALVQGEGATRSVIRALDLLEKHPRVEVIIVGRGGGSAEDLMTFNDEALARRLACVRVPVVSAVGHEIDTSICDLVADARAATPSEAAELVVPDGGARQRELAQWLHRLTQVMHRRLQDDASVVQRVRSKLSDPRFLIAQKQQQLDELKLRSERRMRTRLGPHRAELNRLEQRLIARHPRTVLHGEHKRLNPLWTRLEQAVRRQLTQHHHLLAQRAATLEALSPLSILGRGYAIALKSDGSALRDSQAARVGETLRLRLARGAVDAQVTQILPPDTEAKL